MEIMWKRYGGDFYYDPADHALCLASWVRSGKRSKTGNLHEIPGHVKMIRDFPIFG